MHVYKYIYNENIFTSRSGQVKFKPHKYDAFSGMFSITVCSIVSDFNFRCNSFILIYNTVTFINYEQSNKTILFTSLASNICFDKLKCVNSGHFVSNCIINL